MTFHLNDFRNFGLFKTAIETFHDIFDRFCFIHINLNPFYDVTIFSVF